MTAVRVSRVAVEAITRNPTPNVRVARVAVEVLQSTGADLPALPTVPQDVDATALTSTSIRVSWTDSDNETGYRILRAYNS